MYPQSMVLSKNKKNIKTFLLKIFVFYNLENLCILHGRVLVMPFSDFWERDAHPYSHVLFEPRREKTGLWGFRPGPTLTNLYQLRKELEA